MLSAVHPKVWSVWPLLALRNTKRFINSMIRICYSTFWKKKHNHKFSNWNEAREMVWRLFPTMHIWMSREWLGQNEGLTGIPWNRTTLCHAAPLRQRFSYIFQSRFWRDLLYRVRLFCQHSFGKIHGYIRLLIQTRRCAGICFSHGGPNHEYQNFWCQDKYVCSFHSTHLFF